jgi:hypothetical protein
MSSRNFCVNGGATGRRWAREAPMSEFLSARAECPCRARPWERGDPRVLSWECGHCGGRWRVTAEQVPLVAELRAECERLRRLVAGLADRVAAQSELLTARAGRPGA